MFEVRGGVYTDMSFTFVTPGTEERYGPFKSREEAVTVWRGKMGNNIDTCEHRLFVVDVDPRCRYVSTPEAMFERVDGPSISVCDKCGAEYPSAPVGTIHKCGRCSGGYCKRRVN